MKIYELWQCDETHGLAVSVDDGQCVVFWHEKSVEIYPRAEKMREALWSFEIRQVADLDFSLIRHLVNNRVQDETENVDAGLTVNGRYLWEERNSLLDMFYKSLSDWNR